MAELDPASLAQLYRWIDTIPLDRPKRNIARDFSDGVLMSQVIHYFFPKLVELHNYSPSNSVEQKNYNWKTMNQKVFKKMGFMLSPLDIEAVVQCKKHAIERILMLMQTKIGEHQAAEAAAADRAQRTRSVSPEAPPPPPPVRHASPPVAAAPAAAGKKRAPAAGSTVAGRSQQPHGRHPSDSPPAAAAAPGGRAGAAGAGGGGSSAVASPAADASLSDLRETVDILQLKVQKLEQLLRLKNSKIAALQQKLEEVTGQPQQ